MNERGKERIINEGSGPNARRLSRIHNHAILAASLSGLLYVMQQNSATAYPPLSGERSVASGRGETAAAKTTAALPASVTKAYQTAGIWAGGIVVASVCVATWRSAQQKK